MLENIFFIWSTFGIGIKFSAFELKRKLQTLSTKLAILWVKYFYNIKSLPDPKMNVLGAISEVKSNVGILHDLLGHLNEKGTVDL